MNIKNIITDLLEKKHINLNLTNLEGRMISLEDKKQKLLTQRTLKKKVEDVILKVLFDSI